MHDAYIIFLAIHLDGLKVNPILIIVLGLRHRSALLLLSILIVVGAVLLLLMKQIMRRAIMQKWEVRGGTREWRHDRLKILHLL